MLQPYLVINVTDFSNVTGSVWEKFELHLNFHLPQNYLLQSVSVKLIETLRNRDEVRSDDGELGKIFSTHV